MATRRQKAKKRATSPTRDKLVRKRKPNEPKSGNLKPVITGLKTELREALEQQRATAQVLQVINASHGNLEPIFDIILENAIDLCGAKFGVLFLHDGKIFTVEAARNVPPAYEETVRGQAFAPGTNPVLHHLQEHKAPFQVKDVFDEAYVARDPLRVAAIELAGVRSLVAVPLLKGAELIGFVGIYRDKPGGFADGQIALVSAFADQAVIAIENARLLSEQHEALERQTATAEVLQVINSSPGDLAPVFDAVLKSATRLCDAAFGILWLCDGEHFHAAALYGASEGYAEIARAPHRPLPSNPLGRLLRGERLIVSLDVAAEEPYRAGDPVRRALVDVGGARSVVQVALVKDDVLLGSLTVYRQEVRGFSDKQIALLQNFAAQAVIAIENTRLLTEQKEALDRQTATAEVLQVINSSPGDLAPVFDAMLDKALQLCGAAFGILWTFDGEFVHAAAIRGATTAYAEFLTSMPHRPGVDNAHGRLLRGEEFVHIADVAADTADHSEDPVRQATIELGGARTLLAVALRKGSVVLGFFVIYRREVRPFGEKQISLLQNFAAQAVIAIENARLITETREALEQQTATAEVLQIINLSPGHLAPVFEAILEKAMHVCRASFGGLWTFDADRYVVAALHNVPKAYADFLRNTTVVPGPGSAPYRFLHGERSVIQNIDLAAEEPYRSGDPQRRALVDLGGARSALQVPLCKDDTVIGVVTIYRQEVREFDERQIALLQSFADQAVIAIENARLFEELRDRQAELRVTFDNMGDGVAMFDAEPRLAAWNRNFEEIIGLPDALLAERPSYAEYLRLLAERGEFGTENVEAELASRLRATPTAS